MTPRPQWQSRGQIAVFVRCLRFLDFQTLEDWPRITEQSFSSKSNLQQRLKCVEWSLYRLFERYDHHSCQEKLFPFFPPSTHLQSLNLRAALFRQLTDLKKQGVLGQHLQLRRTMLDECRGEKFEEVMATFAMTVLRKTLQAGDLRVSDNVVSENKLPTILAYRKSLQKNLDERKAVTNRTLEIRTALSASSNALALKEREILSQSIPIADQKEQMLEGLVRANWLGESSWIDVILNGISEWQGSPAGQIVNENMTLGQGRSTSLTRELHDRINHHQQRLDQWSRTFAELSENQAIGHTPENREAASEPTKSFFNRHQSLRSLTNVQTAAETSLEYRRLFLSLESEIPNKTHSRKSATTMELPILTITETKHAGLRELHSPGQSQDISESGEMEILDHDTSPKAVEAISNFALKGDSQSLPPIQDLNRKSLSLEPVDESTTKRKHRPLANDDLIERTRASMTRSEYNSECREDEIESVDDDHALQMFKELRTDATDINTHSSLVERTRQSMSLWSDSPPNRLKGQVSKLGSENKQHPFNQSETQIRLRTSLQPHWTPDSGRSTPRDKLFDEDADVTSVFRSRPRLATSPALSPQQSDALEDSILG